MENSTELSAVKEEIKEFCEVLFLRLYDKLENIEQSISVAQNNRSAVKNSIILLDNVDLMEITQLSYSRLKAYRKLGLLISNDPINKGSKNLYTLQEVERFLKEVLGLHKKINVKRSVKDKFR